MATQSNNKPKQTTNKAKATNKPKTTTKPKEKDNTSSQGEDRAKTAEKKLPAKGKGTDTEAKPTGVLSKEGMPTRKEWKNRNSPMIGNNGFDLTQGDNRKAISDMLHVYSMPPIDIDSDEAVEQRIFEYFQYCIEKDIRPGVEGMAMALGVNRRTLWDWETGNRRGNSIVRADIIKKAKQFIALYLENLAQNNKIYPATWIFMMKNHYGYKDQQDITITPNNQLQPNMTREQIIEKVKADVVIDIDED